MVSLFSYEAVAETLKAIFPQLSVVQRHTYMTLYVHLSTHIHVYVYMLYYIRTCIIVYTCMYIHIVVVFEENSRKRKYHK